MSAQKRVVTYSAGITILLAVSGYFLSPWVGVGAIIAIVFLFLFSLIRLGISIGTKDYVPLAAFSALWVAIGIMGIGYAYYHPESIVGMLLTCILFFCINSVSHEKEKRS